MSRRRLQHPNALGSKRSASNSSTPSLRSVIEGMPITGREFATSCMSKQDVLVTMDSCRSFSKRSLDVASREFASKSSRAFSVASSSHNIYASRDLEGVGEVGEGSQEIKNGESLEEEEGGCCGGVWKSLDQDPTAKGYAILGICRGTILMSNVFLSTSLIYLANVHAGCVDEDGNLIDNCNGKAYGFKPASLITNISVISGLLAAFLVPVLGAIVDYTPHRRLLGIVTAVVVTLIQAVQIGTVQATWFPMAILQAFVGFLYFIQSLPTFAYLPEMARNVGGTIMNNFTKWFTFIQFSSQFVFMACVIIVGFALALDTVQTAQFGQALSSLACIGGFGYAWGFKLPNRPAARILPEGQSLWLQGFKQNFRTISTISKLYKKGLKWFMLTVAVSEAGVTALLPVGITFLTEEVKLDALEIGIVFAIALITSLIGAVAGAMITAKTNPRNSWVYCLLYFVIVTCGGTFALSEERSYLGNVWGALWGFGLGWYYPVENLMFSLCLPQGSENEMTGLFMYMTQILVWLPSFLFSSIIEAGVDTRWGYFSLIAFQAGGIGLLLCMAPWREVLEEADKIIKPESATKSIANSAPGQSYNDNLEVGEEKVNTSKKEQDKLGGSKPENSGNSDVANEHNSEEGV